MTYDPLTAQKNDDYNREDYERYLALQDDYEADFAHEMAENDRLNDYGSVGWALEANR